MRSARRSLIGHAVTAGSIAVIGLLTLRPYSGPIASFAWCLLCGEFQTRDVILNFLLFIPLGVGLSLERHRFRRSAILILITTLVVECLQATVVPGRSSTLSDIVTNSAGGIAGYWLTARWPAWVLPARRRSRRLLLAYVVAFVALQATVSSAAVRLRGAPEYWGQWTHVWRTTVPFRGTLQSFVVNGKRVPDDRGRMLAGSITPLLLGDSIQLSIDVTPGPPVERLAAIASVSNETRGNILLVGQFGRDLIVRERMRGSRAGMRTPTFRFADVFAESGEPTPWTPPDASRSSTHVDVSFTDRQIVVTFSRDTVRRTRAVAITPALAWAFLDPFESPISRAATAINVCWIVILFFPLGYWLARSTRRESRPEPVVSRLAQYALALASAVIGLEVLPVLAGISPSTWGEWMGAIVGAVAGGIVARRVGNRVRRSTLHVDESRPDEQGRHVTDQLGHAFH